MEGFEIDDELIWEFNRVRLFQMFRWTPEVVDNLSQHDLGMIMAVQDAEQQHDPKARWLP
jgi:hypothetical protein